MSNTFSRAQQLHAEGQLDAARLLYEQCLREAPDDWRALTRLGLLRLQQRRFDVAAELLQRAITLNPANAEAHAWLAEAWRHEGKLEAAIASFQQALSINPDLAPACFNLGLALMERKELDAASASWVRFLQLRPGDSRVRRELAGVAVAQGNLGQAASWLAQHLGRFPADVRAASELGAIYLRQGEPDAALRVLRSALEVEPDNAQVVYQAAIAFERQAHLQSAIEWLQRAARLAPGRADIQNSLAVAHHNFAQHEEALAHYRKALAIEPDFAEVHSNLLMALHYVDEDCETVYREHLAWAAQHAGRIVPASHDSFANPRDADRRLRIGYVSPRFCAGPIARLLLPLLAEHDHARFHVTCYAVSDVHDAVTDEMRSHADAWREASALDDVALRDLIREDAIDILVDLAGHCPGHRLRVFAHRAAPVQMTWLDYSNTTGLRAMDYFVGDAVQTSQGSPQRFTEEVVRLPDTRLCYGPLPGLPELVTPPAARKGYVTFGCINRLSKLNPTLIAAWSEILNAVAGSRLLLKATAYASEEVRGAVRTRFARNGITAERLDFRAYSDEAQMMAEYGDIDICLDPFPYNGSTTTCDALTMGVPVVTLAGAALAARAGLMFLTACGMQDWVAHSMREYVRLACDAAQDVPRLAALRPRLRARFLASPVCDAPRFARAFEDIYREVWRRVDLVAGRAPG